MLHHGGRLATVVLCLVLTGPSGAQTPGDGIDRRAYEVDLIAAARRFVPDDVGDPRSPLDGPGGPFPAPARRPPAARRVEELFQVTIEAPGVAPLLARTHLFRDPLRIIPFADADDTRDAGGNVVPRGDAAIAGYFAAGEVGFAITHRRPFHRALSLSSDPSGLKEEIRLQDTHLGIVIGVMRSGLPGAITCSSPQNYLEGRFGEIGHSIIFVRPKFPPLIDGAARKLMMGNLRTMVLGFNAVNDHPAFEGRGDPLGARNPQRIGEHVAMMIRGISGEDDALTYFQDDRHRIHPAELAYIATSAALLVPLNDQHALPLLQAHGLSEVRAGQVWRKFQQEIDLHNRGQPSTFATMNRNKLVRLVELADNQALLNLKPITEYGDSRARALMGSHLAFPPMTVSDMIESFLQIHLPRQELGERIAPTQASFLRAVKPGLMEAAGLTEESEAGTRLSALVDTIAQVVEKPYPSHDAYRQALQPYLAMGRGLAGPRPDEREGAAFVPPMLFHLVARGDRPGGLISLEYVGHGMHYGLVKPVVTRP